LTIQVDFSNYAHVDDKRRISKGSKRYDFEYGSTKYQWRRTVCKDGILKKISYHLINTATSKSVAHIIPETLTPLEAVEEESKGGWVPPSSMWISDPSAFERMKDVADVIVATGLIALVDDCIKRRWGCGGGVHPNSHIKSSLTRNVDALASTKIIDKVFHHVGASGSRHTNSLRQIFAHHHLH